MSADIPSEWLVDVAWVADHRSDPGVYLADTREGSDYIAEHLPDAVHLDLYHEFCEDTRPEGLARFVQGMADAIGRAGIDGSETAVLYDAGTDMYAPRAAWILDYLGHPSVRWMEGGINAWRGAGLPLVTMHVGPVPKTFTARPRPERVAAADEIHAHLSDPDWVILDVRSEAEHQGTDNRPCCPRPGRIPGTVWLEWTQLLEGRERFKSAEEMAQKLEALGITRDKTVVTYCHRGARAANTYWALRHLGYPNVRNHIGSWHEWSRRMDLPIEAG